MGRRQRQSGFSLTEVLMSVGILAIGMMFIAGVFPAAIYYSTVASERTIGAIVSDEAFAKVRLFGAEDPNLPLSAIDMNGLKSDEMADFNDLSRVFPMLDGMARYDFSYPSDKKSNANKQYYWSALCRLTDDYHPVTNPNPPVQVTVFVSRKPGPNLRYYDPHYNISDFPANGLAGPWPSFQADVVERPMPVKVAVTQAVEPDRLVINNTQEFSLINDGYTIVDNATGRIYRVLERLAAPEEDIIILDRPWTEATPANVWVVPPPVSGGRRPCVAVYQRVIRF
ncbi:MAG: type IV pilus modification PilV family protein [Planctomycetota bacterium]